MRQWTGSALIPITACRLFGAKPLSKPILGYCQLDIQLTTNFRISLMKIQNFSFTKMRLKIYSVKWQTFCPWGNELIQSLLQRLHLLSTTGIYIYLIICLHLPGSIRKLSTSVSVMFGWNMASLCRYIKMLLVEFPKYKQYIKTEMQLVVNILKLPWIVHALLTFYVPFIKSSILQYFVSSYILWTNRRISLCIKTIHMIEIILISTDDNIWEFLSVIFTYPFRGLMQCMFESITIYSTLAVNIGRNRHAAIMLLKVMLLQTHIA